MITREKLNELVNLNEADILTGPTILRSPMGGRYVILRTNRGLLRQQIKSFVLIATTGDKLLTYNILPFQMRQFSILSPKVHKGLNVEDLAMIFKYHNGELYRKFKSLPDRVTGTKDGFGYNVVSYKKKVYRVSHIILALHGVTGLKTRHISHIDGNNQNDNIENLKFRVA